MKSLLCLLIIIQGVSSQNVPLVINTWQFSDAAKAAWDALEAGQSRLDAVVTGCSQCEFIYRSCDSSVGWGGSPDESGETTLDAMVMDGPTHDVGAVGCLRGVKNAIGVARAVMEHTKHTLLVGQFATDFALEMGFEASNLSSADSIRQWENWKASNCQPNYRKNVSPDPSTSCGPYSPNPVLHTNPDYLKFTPYQKPNSDKAKKQQGGNNLTLKNKNKAQRSDRNQEPELNVQNPGQKSLGRNPEEGHDTIAMIVIDEDGNFAAGTSTNGARSKVPGRVGDSPIAGAGSYVDNEVGGAGATGDGDIMVRFLPSLRVVEMMRGGMDPLEAIKQMLSVIEGFYPGYAGAMVAVNKQGEYGGACVGFAWFKYSVVSPATGQVQVIDVDCHTQ